MIAFKGSKSWCFYSVKPLEVPISMARSVGVMRGMREKGWESF
jgi:hypothetical protein